MGVNRGRDSRGRIGSKREREGNRGKREERKGKERRKGERGREKGKGEKGTISDPLKKSLNVSTKRKERVQ